MKKDDTKQYYITFTYTCGATQSVTWSNQQIPFGNIEALAEQWRHDLNAKTYSIK